ncbi:MAG: DUF3105 domain-containing protein [Chloroflexia bacterium]
MSKVPPKRSGQPSSTGGEPRSSQSGLPPKSNRPVPPRQPQQYAEDDWDEEYDDQEYAPPQRSARQPGPRPPARSTGPQARYSGPPPRNSSGARRRQPTPRYVQPRRDMFPILMGGLIGMGVVGIMIIAFLLLNKSNTTTTTTTTPPTTDTSSGNLPVSTMVQNPSGQQTMQALRPATGLGTPVPDEGNTHVDDGTAITYKTYPPSSGTHFNDTAPYGFSEVQLKEGNFVHSMEHGSIVIYYKQSVSADIKQKLKDAYNTLPAGKYGKVKLVTTPYENMTTPLAIAAWDRLLLMNDFNYDEIQTFYTTWVDKGPEDVP